MRQASIKRETKETKIEAAICLDGGEISVSTGLPFFDHMLTAFATHGGFGLVLDAKGDIEVDGHHAVEDTGIVLGKAFAEALGEKSGINRFGSFYVPMDEALAFCAVDLSGRAFLVFDADFPQEKIGSYESCLTLEFFRAFCDNAKITLHIKSEYGGNAHHITEAIFKAVGHALRVAATANGGGTLSTKGVLE